MGILMFGAVTGLVGFTLPNWWSETGVVILLTISLTLIWGWIWGSRKWGVLIGVGIVGILLLRRWGIADGLSVGLWLAVLGLITLIN